ncbi:MAG: glycosyltransferase family 39 protein [Alphaproteobacteria bacterium]
MFGDFHAHPTRTALILIAAFALLRVGFAWSLGFGVDESYTLGQARSLALSYFDHPPAHLWFAHGAMSLFGTNWMVRLPTIALFALSGWLLYRLTARLFSAQAGVWAVFTLNVSPFFLASPGTWIVPDGPLLAALAGAAVILARLFFPEPNETPSPWASWLGAGALFGLAGLSKYSALVVALGLVGFMALSRQRRWFAHPALYAGAALGLLVISPVLIWNLQNDWVSFRFQAGRTTATGLTPLAFAQMLGGQLIWLAPWIAIPLCYGLVAGLKRWREPEQAFLLALGLPTILLFTVQSLWSGAALPHWPMPGWFFMMPLLGAWIVGHPERDATTSGWARWSAGLAVGIVALAGSLGATGALTRAGLPVSADPTFDAADWDRLKPALLARGVGRPDGPVLVALRWNEGGKIDLVMGDIAPVMVDFDDPRGFSTRQDIARYVGKPGIIIATPRSFARDEARLRQAHPSMGAPETIFVGRQGRDELGLVVVPVARLGVSAAPRWRRDP